MRNKHDYCNLSCQTDLVLYHETFKGLFSQKDAVKHFLKFLILVYSPLLMLLSQRLEEKYPPPHPSLPILHFLFGKHCSFFAFLNSPKIDTAVLFDNNAHFYFLVHRKPYYMRTSLINSLTDSYRIGYMNQKMCFIYLSTAAQKSQKREHTTLFF